MTETDEHFGLVGKAFLFVVPLALLAAATAGPVIVYVLFTILLAVHTVYAAQMARVRWVGWQWVAWPATILALMVLGLIVYLV